MNRDHITTDLQNIMHYDVCTHELLNWVEHLRWFKT